MKASVETSVQLFCTGNQTDIFEAGKSLLMQVHWLLGYHDAASKDVEAPPSYQQLTAARQIQALTLSE